MYDLIMLLAFPISATATPQRLDPAAVAGQFQAAYGEYQAGHFPAAAGMLEELSRRVPGNFDVEELLGLTYAAESEQAKAVEPLRAAVRARPGSVSAHNNLATSLVQNQQPEAAKTEWRAALGLDATDFTANRNLARFYVQEGQVEAALPLLHRAWKKKPEDLDNGYDLALADVMTGRVPEARAVAEDLLRRKDSAEVHALLGQIDEKQGRYVEAVNEFSAAAHADPSEANLFAWAGELLTHRAYTAAIAISEEGTHRYPSSSRLWVGQGMALYARGEYERSIQALLEATDLDAGDSRAYLFLSKAYFSSPSQAEAVIERFRRYAALKPEDSQAQLYYALSLWRGKRVDTPEIDYTAVEKLLRRAIALDDRNAEAHLQLGILLNDQQRYAPAQAEFERAVALEPGLPDAHFRLGRAYMRAGEKEKAQKELDRFKVLLAEKQATVDRERAEVQQFVVAAQTAAPAGAATDGSKGTRP